MSISNNNSPGSDWVLDFEPPAQSSSTTPIATTSQASATATPQDKHDFLIKGSQEDDHHGVKRSRDDDDDGDDARFRGGECGFEDRDVPVNTVEVDDVEQGENANVKPVSFRMRFWLRVRKLIGC